MSPQEAAGTILVNKIPFLVAVGALGGIKGKTDIILALIERMSGNELITNTQMLTKMGVFENAALKSAYDDAVQRARNDQRVSTMKAGRAAQSVAKVSEKAASVMQSVQTDRLEKLGGIEGDWLVLGDRSGSMHVAIDVARVVASLIAQQVKGKVYLIFFNDEPTYFDVTDKSLEEIIELTKRQQASGGTSISCGLEYIRFRNITVQGIALCSDGGENRAPTFGETYQRYVSSTGIEPTVYLFHVPGDPDYFSKYCAQARVQVTKFELGHHVDYYSLPNLVRTMRASRFSLVDEIMETKLLTFNDVFKKKET